MERKVNIKKLDFLVVSGALIVVPLTLLFGLKANTIAIAFLSIITLILFLIKPKKKISLKKIEVIYLFLFFFIQAIGLIYTNDLTKGLKQIETKFSFLLFPIIFLALYKLGYLTKEIINRIIVALGVLLILYFYLYALPVWINNNIFSIKDLNQLLPAETRHVYFSIYSSFSFFFFYHYSRGLKEKNLKALFFIASILLFFIPIILTARITSFINLLFAIYIIFSDKNVRWVFVTVLSVLAISFVLLINKSPGKIKRIENLFKNDRFYNPIFHRKNNIVCAYEIFKKNPIKGVGLGSVQHELNKCYKERNYWGRKENYNAHNEYLEEVVRHGIIGLINILFLYGFALYLSFKKKNKMYLGFMIVIMIASLTESLFSRQVGVVFFCFFNSMFFITQQLIKRE